jgi:predicted acyl esterase
MVLDEVYAITIELFPIANLFCRGHRPRLDISSSNFPHFDVNPNSGEPEGEWQQPHRPQPRLRRGRPILAHPVADHSVGWVKIQF